MYMYQNLLLLTCVDIASVFHTEGGVLWYSVWDAEQVINILPVGIRSNPEERGVIPNSFEHVFTHIDRTENEKYLVRVSYLEIYQEEIRDLLSKDHKSRLELREKPDTGVYVKVWCYLLGGTFSPPLQISSTNALVNPNKRHVLNKLGLCVYVFNIEPTVLVCWSYSCIMLIG